MFVTPAGMPPPGELGPALPGAGNRAACGWEPNELEDRLWRRTAISVLDSQSPLSARSMTIGCGQVHRHRVRS